MTAALAVDLDGSFEALVRGHQDLLFGVALRILADAADAEEAAQDAFVRAYRALAGYDAERIRRLSLRGWLVTIVVNVCRNRLRRTSPRRVSLDTEAADGHEPVDDGPGPEERTERREARDHWAALVAGLPERYREVVVLRHVEGLPYEELALVLGRPEGTLKAQAHRGLALLRAAHEASLRATPTISSRSATHPASSHPPSADLVSPHPGPAHEPSERPRQAVGIGRASAADPQEVTS